MSKKFEKAIENLADVVPNGRLLAATSGAGLLSAAASEIRDLRAEVESLLRERNLAREERDNYSMRWQRANMRYKAAEA